MTELQRLSGSPGCFICDNNGSNPRSLGLAIWWDEAKQMVSIPLNPDQSWCGYNQVVHGGLVASVLDEGMAWAVKHQSGQWAFTVDFHLRLKKPVEPGKQYLVQAQTGDTSGRKITAQAQLLDDQGQAVAQAEAVFLPGRGQARPQSAY